jgi:hypothetical protein
VQGCVLTHDDKQRSKMFACVGTRACARARVRARVCDADVGMCVSASAHLFLLTRHTALLLDWLGFGGDAEQLLHSQLQTLRIGKDAVRRTNTHTHIQHTYTTTSINSSR